MAENIEEFENFDLSSYEEELSPETHEVFSSNEQYVVALGKTVM